MKFARIENNKVVEILEMDSITNKFHPSLIFVECYTNTKVGDQYIDKQFITSDEEKLLVLSYAELRSREYPPIQEQLDMQYWDKVNGTNVWQKTIEAIKAKYPKV